MWSLARFTVCQGWICLQRVTEMYVGANVLLAIFQIACALCGLLGLLGALQALPAVAVMTSAIRKTAGSLIEFSVIVVVVLPLAGMICYNASMTDEKLTLPAHLFSFMVISTFLGVQPPPLWCRPCAWQYPTWCCCEREKRRNCNLPNGTLACRRLLVRFQRPGAARFRAATV